MINMTAPKIIPTRSLKRDAVPSAEAKWENIAAFALTFDPHEMGAYGQKAADLSNASPNSSLTELRSHLYVEQRRWNHLGRVPDGDVMQQLAEIVSLIRQRLTEEH
jgi:hypothetical protein